MVKKTKQVIVNIFLLIAAFLISSCANQLPPGGGEVDKIPPEIIELYPQDGTINFDDNYFELGFSEYVDKRSVKDAIFISPAIDGELELSWSGRYVQVEFPSALRENTTYVITLGTDVVDHNNRNRMAQSFSFTFSTGDKIDRRIISGKVYDEKPEGVMMFAYKLDRDTIDPSVSKPDYVSQCGNDGSYKLLGLAASSYRIFAVKDEFRDLLYNVEQDKIGVPAYDVVLDEDDSLYTGLDFFLTKKDTTPPRLLTAAMTDKNHILLNISEEFDSSIINKANFSVVDSITNRIIIPEYIYRHTKKNTEIILVIDDSLNQNYDYFLTANVIKDLTGNIFKNDIVSLTISDKADTSKPGIVKTIPQIKSTNVDYTGTYFQFYFTDAFDSTKLKSGITFSDTLGKPVAYRMSFPDDATLEIKPVKDLEVQKDYEIKIDLSKAVDVAGNKYDSMYVFRFKTISGLEFTGVSGIVESSDSTQPLMLVLEDIANKDKVYKQKVNRSFNFERVEAGKYVLWAHSVSDSTDFNHGEVYPYKPADWFRFYPDTLNLKPRWSLLDLVFDTKKKK